jgi:hypothetical protein
MKHTFVGQNYSKIRVRHARIFIFSLNTAMIFFAIITKNCNFIRYRQSPTYDPHPPPPHLRQILHAKFTLKTNSRLRLAFMAACDQLTLSAFIQQSFISTKHKLSNRKDLNVCRMNFENVFFVYFCAKYVFLLINKYLQTHIIMFQLVSVHFICQFLLF